MFGLSFWRHPFRAEDPLMSKWCDVKFIQTFSEEEKNSSTSFMVWDIFCQFLFLGELFLYSIIPR